VQAPPDCKQRLKALFFLEGIAYGGNQFNRTAVTAPLFSYSAPTEGAEEFVVSRIFASWNQLDGWLLRLDRLRRAA